MGKNQDKNIVVFGATGKTGHQIVRYALEKGYHVTAFVRDKSKLTLKYSSLKIIKGDVLKPLDVEKAVKDQEVVITALGVSPGQSPVCCPGVQNILDAMKKNRVKKLIALSAFGARESSRGFYGKMLNLMINKIMRDKNEMEELIENSRVEWTVIRPVILTNGLGTDDYSLSIDEHVKGIHFISREDTARFIIDSIDKKNYKKRFVTIYR